MPLAYLASSLAAGGLLFVAVESVTKVDFKEIRAMRLPIVVVAALSAVCLIGYVAVIGFDKAQETNALLLWGGIVVCGVVLTLASGVLFYLAKEKTVMALSFVGLAAAFIGSLSVRVLMWSMTSGFLNLFENAAGFYPLQGF
jgi:anaerobic dimethyl sulfoxide reductase subunit C (anchor subunit)